MSESPETSAWWQSGIVYQIYPRSFMDSNGDGVGDLPGIIDRLDYLVWLGVSALWISPVFSSPMADFGYDISDYQKIAPIFGTLEDFDRLVAEAHRLQLKIILDFVPNHTSNEHPWFLDSRSSRSHPKRDWYIWRDASPDGGPPTNWVSEFGGSAWTWDELSGQYYYHAYLAAQPDLNWRNVEVQQAMCEVLRFWLQRGVDGFRVDAIHMLIEDESLIDNPPNPAWQPGMSPARSLLRVYTSDQAGTQDMIRQMRHVLDEFKNRVLIGEAYLPIDRLMLYYGESLQGFHLPFNFHLLHTPWIASSIAALVKEYEAALPPGGWPNWVLGNHDKSRLINRVGSLAHARLAALLLLTLRGTPTIYYGEELGMSDVDIPAESLQDPWEINVPGLGLGRDPCRTPMPWSPASGAGFTSGTPWLPIGAESWRVNVESESSDSASMLSLYRDLIHLRRREAALTIGSYRERFVEDNVFAYERASGSRRLLIALNFADTPYRLIAPMQLILSTSPSRDIASHAAEITLGPFEGVIGALDQGT